jgi:D-sedoheptulose 7-phosphate isomerase
MMTDSVGQDAPTHPESAASATSRAALDSHELMCAGLRNMVGDIETAAGLVSASLASGGQLLLCGNGGSAADAQHIAAEFLGRFLRERRPLPAIALHGNTSAVTAIGNDYGFDQVFARQVEACGRPGDVLIALTTSGESPNVVRAAAAARSANVKVIGLTGSQSGSLAPLCDVLLAVPATATPRIQEGHALIGHIVCEIVEDALFTNGASAAE